jgi:nucleotide-binding universal stress UspA family protein
MAGTIVVGVDGSDTAFKAAETAAQLAAQTGATLHVVTAFDEDAAEEIKVGSDSWLVSGSGDAEGLANSIAAKLRSIAPTITFGIGQGKPHEVLITEADRVQATMIVVGNRRMQGVGRILGSVANSVAHHAPCDVYIVKTV